MDDLQFHVLLNVRGVFEETIGSINRQSTVLGSALCAYTVNVVIVF